MSGPHRARVLACSRGLAAAGRARPRSWVWLAAAHPCLRRCCPPTPSRCPRGARVPLPQGRFRPGLVEPFLPLRRGRRPPGLLRPRRVWVWAPVGPAHPAGRTDARPAARRLCYDAFTENMAGEAQLLERRRLYHCAAYNCAIAAIRCVFTELKFYQGFLFSEKPEKVGPSRLPAGLPGLCAPRAGPRWVCSSSRACGRGGRGPGLASAPGVSAWRSGVFTWGFAFTELAHF